ncbi:MAG: pirin family protein [Bacteroidetes bacterium]|nr:MAG: pirin family protein [Bacteroidota bacterium]
MNDRKIIDIHPAMAAHMPGLSTWRAMPTARIEWLDPFLFLNHHGPDVFRPNNRGLPFGPHPHRGFETLTYILEGELIHKDTTGYNSNIKTGGVQWMTAGSGLLHSETSSEEFKKEGGAVELIQLWLNLPSKLKMTPPSYTGLQENELVHFDAVEGVRVHLLSGEFLDHKGPIDSITNLTMTWMELRENSKLDLQVDPENQILLYVVSGKLDVNGREAGERSLVQFDHEGTDIHLQAQADTRILFGYGKPFNEPIAAYGPFVMNSEAELQEAFNDYQNGKLGVWKD